MAAARQHQAMKALVIYSNHSRMELQGLDHEITELCI